MNYLYAIVIFKMNKNVSKHESAEIVLNITSPTHWSTDMNDITLDETRSIFLIFSLAKQLIPNCTEMGEMVKNLK